MSSQDDETRGHPPRGWTKAPKPDAADAFAHDQLTRQASPMDDAVARAAFEQFRFDQPASDDPTAGEFRDDGATRFEPAAQLLMEARHPDEETPPPDSQSLADYEVVVTEFEEQVETRFDGAPRGMEIAPPKLFRMEYQAPGWWQRSRRKVRSGIVFVTIAAGVGIAGYGGYKHVRSRLVPADTSYIDGGAPR